MKSIDTIRLRAILGWLGLLLPWIVLGLCLWFKCVPWHIVPDSISITYYYAPTITPFMIILGAAGILLICYRGYNHFDDAINTITGIAGLGICLFPCATGTGELVGTFQLNEMTSGWIHNSCALSFFGLLAYNSLFIFTKSSGDKTRNKKIRNIIYIICGIGMILSLLGIIAVVVFNIHAGTWLVETVALFFFGLSFLTKADIYPWLFCDSPHVDEPTDNA